MPSHVNEPVNLNSNNSNQPEHNVDNEAFHDNNNDNMVEDNVEMINENDSINKLSSEHATNTVRSRHHEITTIASIVSQTVSNNKVLDGSVLSSFNPTLCRVRNGQSIRINFRSDFSSIIHPSRSSNTNSSINNDKNSEEKMNKKRTKAMPTIIVEPPVD